MKQLLLIDGNALIHRAFHALPPLTDEKGNLVNAVYGFTSAVLTALKQFQPEYIAVTFDVGRKTFRNEIYDQYKATRPETDEGLAGQFVPVRKVTKALNIPVFALEGFEADDLIGTLVAQAEKIADLEIIILTGDNDALQLVSDKTKVSTFGRGLHESRIYDSDAVRLKYGFSPDQIIDYKALAGDSSDNIPGVNGIGAKTATSLLQEYKDLDNMYANLDKIKESVRKKLSDDKDRAYISQKLARINQEAPIELDLEKCKVTQFDGFEARKLFVELNFKSLLARLPQESSKPGQAGLFSPEIESELSSKQGKGSDGSEAEKIDAKLVPILDKITRNGILVDCVYLKDLANQAGTKIKELEKEIYKFVGHAFNLNSPSQLAPVLYDELKLSPDDGKRIKKGKTHRSTAASELEKLKKVHPVINLLLEYREFTKLKNTYLDPLPTMVDQNNRLHTTFAQDTATGRLSSKNPNLQNIPVSEGFGGKIRQAFIADKDKILISADYSQIELRVAAHMSGDKAMIEAFEGNRDFHSEVSKALGVDRRMAKAINFGILYGMNPYGLATRLDIKVEDAKRYIENYFITFSGLSDYINQTLELAREKGYVETLFGRRRFMPELGSNSALVRQGAERAATNMPLQGTAADIMKLAMIAIDQKMPNLKIVLQIHDELLFEVPKDAPKSLDDKIDEIMTGVAELKVPLKVEINRGKTWAETKK